MQTTRFVVFQLADFLLFFFSGKCLIHSHLTGGFESFPYEKSIWVILEHNYTCFYPIKNNTRKTLEPLIQVLSNFEKSAWFGVLKGTLHIFRCPAFASPPGGTRIPWRVCGEKCGNVEQLATLLECRKRKPPSILVFPPAGRIPEPSAQCHMVAVCYRAAALRMVGLKQYFRKAHDSPPSWRILLFWIDT